MSEYTGKLIVFEGIDGSGKTTQVNYFKELLTNSGFDVVGFREPGSTEAGEQIRNTLLNVDMDGLTELLLFNASRVENIKKNILPALEAGKIVVCDRFTDSTIAYQGFGRGYLAEALMLQPLIDKLVVPDYRVFLNITIEESLKRLSARTGQSHDRLDALDTPIKHRIANGYHTTTGSHKNVEVFDASGSITDIQNNIALWFNNYVKPNITHLQKGN